MEKQERTGVAGNDPEEWKRTCMVDDNGFLFIKSTNLFSMLVTAAKNTKKGKSSLQAATASTVQVEEENAILTNRQRPDEPTNDAKQDVYIDIAGVVNPTTRARNVRYRLAARAGWECTFTIQWDKTIVGRDHMATILTDAGNLVGLGNGRKIGYGRFVVKEFKVNAEV